MIKVVSKEEARKKIVHPRSEDKTFSFYEEVFEAVDALEGDDMVALDVPDDVEIQVYVTRVASAVRSRVEDRGRDYGVKTAKGSDGETVFLGKAKKRRRSAE